MELQRRNNVHIIGDGSVTLVMAHGFGCDQNMWRFLMPHLPGYRFVLFDYMGCGRSDATQYDADRYATLAGYADDLIAVADFAGPGPRVLIGHSVSAMIGLLADQRRPGLFDAHVMIGPSPSYINEGEYVGGFDRADIDELLTTLEGNYLGWASTMAPAIMGAPGQPELSEELANSFCRTAPDIAARFARATFLSNNLADLPRLSVPTLVLQSTDDFIAPVSVGEHISRAVPHGTLRMIQNIGHCPHLSAPKACAEAVDAFLISLKMQPQAA